jgi:hypothetical protein
MTSSGALDLSAQRSALMSALDWLELVFLGAITEA